MTAKQEYTTIMLFDAGSALYGTTTPESDCDTAGIFIEHPHKVLGLDKFEHHIQTTGDGVNRNTADDVDSTLYGLRKWAFLACKGNPTALSYLFVPVYLEVDDIWYQYVATLRNAILARTAAKHFWGFCQGQMGRLLGTRGQGKHGTRHFGGVSVPDYDYDWKAGMHALRLAGEGVELMTTGWITYPRPDYETLLSVRRGEWTLGRLVSEVEDRLNDMNHFEKTSLLPAKPDRDRVTDILTRSYLELWHRRGRI